MSQEPLAKLPKEKQQEILQKYFDPEKGIGYTLGRTNIHSCDFSSSSYTYANENDAALTSFSVAHDKEFRIPFIRQAFSLRLCSRIPFPGGEHIALGPGVKANARPDRTVDLPPQPRCP